MDPVARGRAAEDEGRYEEALAAYREAVNLDPTDEVARRGVAQIELIERVDQAREGEMHERLAADPLDAEAAMCVADLSAARGNVEGACLFLLEKIVRVGGSTRRDLHDHVLKLLETMPDDDPIVKSLRSKLSATTFREGGASPSP